MRPRVLFALLSAAGAVLHLFLLRSPAGSPLPLLAYGGWLFLSAAVIAAIALARARGHAASSVRERLLRPRPTAGRPIEGLLWFAATAGGGLLIHIVSLATRSTQSSAQRGLWLIVFLFAIGCYTQLKAAQGKRSAPMAELSSAAVAAGRLRRTTGWTLGAVGALILLRGATFFSGSGARSPDFIEVLFLAGGAMLVLVGVALVWAPSRHDV